MKKQLYSYLPVTLAITAAFFLGFTLGTRHGKAQAGGFFETAKNYYELGKDLGRTIQKIDAEVAELQKNSDHLKQIKGTLSGEKPKSGDGK
jgi:hypothetical protein